MGFASGTVSFARFKVIGDAPKKVDDTALGILTENAFVQQEWGTPNEIEAGFVTGQHLLDTQFGYEKNVFNEGSRLLFALRIDTNKVPSELKHAQRRINELAAASQNPSGFATKAQKREAKEIADRTLAEDLAKGKFRRSRMIPVYWDLERQQLYCASASNAVVEQLARLMRQAFEVSIEPLSAGNLALALGQGKTLEDLRASPLTRSPSVRDGELSEMPAVPWASAASMPLDFLGNEFLIWLWYQTREHDGIIELFNKQTISVVIQNRMALACAWGMQGTHGILSPTPTLLLEAMDALASGKWPRQLGLIVADDQYQFEFVLQGDHMTVTAGKLPEIQDAETLRDLVAARLDRIDKLTVMIDMLYLEFLMIRTRTERWVPCRTEIRAWVDRQVIDAEEQEAA